MRHTKAHSVVLHEAAQHRATRQGRRVRPFVDNIVKPGTQAYFRCRCSDLATFAEPLND